MDRLRGVRTATGGPFTRAQALGAGFSEAEVRRHRASSAWVSLRRGVYVEAWVHAAAANDERRKCALDTAALLLALDCDAVAAGRTAARIWGLDLMPRRREKLVVVTAEEGRIRGRGADYVLRTARLPERHRERRFGVPLTSIARTVIDIARRGSVRDGVVVADSALHGRRTTVAELRDVLLECRGWSGLAQARKAVALADPKAESALESLSRVAMHEAGLPAPRTQVWLGRDRVDFYWEEFGVVGEADGLAKYAATGGCTTRDIVRAEKHREARLADRGFEVVRWTWEDALNVPAMARRLRAALARGQQRQRPAA